MSLTLNEIPVFATSGSVSDTIAQHIREVITSGELAEGQPIRQDEFASLFNVSKIPVREALKRLEAEGLVTFQRNKGACVTRMSRTEIGEIFDVRAILEAAAIAFAVPRMDDQAYAEAERHMEAFVQASDPLELSDNNWRFHLALYEQANRPFLLSLIESVKDRIERYLRLQLTLSDGIRVADREHRMILDACRSKDVETAQAMMRNHIVGARNSLLAHLPQ